MSIELKIPDVGESIREVQIGRWLKKEGDSIDQDENVVELETDKASMELPAPAAGVLSKILKQQGDTVAVGEVIAYLEEDGKAPRGKRESDAPAAKKTDEQERSENKPTTRKAAAKEPEQAVADQKQSAPPEPDRKVAQEDGETATETPVTPSARRALRDHGLAPTDIPTKGPRIHRKDVLRYVEEQQKEVRDRKAPSSKQPPTSSIEQKPAPSAASAHGEPKKSCR